MIVTGIEVSGVGRFRGGMRLSGLGPGVNVLAAPNEAGKSTLFRAVRTCFFQKHDAQSQPIRNLASHDAQLPVRIRVSFRFGGHDYTIEKSFLRSPQASLVRDGAEIARGRQADEMLWEILGVSPGSGRSVDDAAFGLLWVGQTKSFGFEAPEGSAADALNAVIAAEVGGVLGGERARSVLAKVKADLAALETDTGKPKAGGPLKAAHDEVERLRAEEAEVSGKLRDLEQAFADLDQARAELARLNDPTLRGELEEGLALARLSFDEAKASAGLLLQAEALEREARARTDAAQAAWKGLQDAAERVAAARAELAGLDERLAELETASAAGQGGVDAALRDVSGIDASLSALARRAEALGRLEQAIQAGARLRELDERRARAMELRGRLAAIAAEVAGIRVTAAKLAEAERLERSVLEAEARREAAAPRLTVALEPGAAGRILVGEEPLGADLSRAVLESLTLTIPGVGTVTVNPSVGGAKAGAELSGLRRDLDAALARMGAANVGEARAALRRREALAREAEGLEAELARLSPKGAGAEDGLARLDADIARAGALVASALAESGRAALPEADEVALEREAAQREEAELRTRRDRAAAALERVRSEAGRLASALSEVRGRRHGVEQALAVALRSAPDETRDADLARLLAAREEAAAEALRRQDDAARRRNATPSQEETRARELKVQRLIQALENHDGRRNGLLQAVAGLEGGIMAAGGDGLGERLAALSDARELAERELARRQEEAASLRLLRETIQASLDAGQERYFAPVRRQLKPFLGDLFPDADLDLGDGFQPSGLRRASAVERFDLLSDGTREQIAVLVRLALGGLLAARGEPVPLILDDALVFSDDERIDLMFNALSRAAESQQVIVLTCRTRTFAPLGGRVLRMEPVPEPA